MTAFKIDLPWYFQTDAHFIHSSVKMYDDYEPVPSDLESFATKPVIWKLSKLTLIAIVGTALILSLGIGLGIGLPAANQRNPTDDEDIPIPPNPGSNPSLSFVVLGNWGSNGISNQTRMANHLADICARYNCAFVLGVGDNFYPDGVYGTSDPMFQDRWKNVFKQSSLQIPWYGILGHNDYRGNLQAQINYSQVDPLWVMPARYYSQRISASPIRSSPSVFGVELVMLDTTPLIQEYHTDNFYNTTDAVKQNTTAQLDWFKSKLSMDLTHPRDWRFVVGHHPIYSYANSSSGVPFPELTEAIEPTLDLCSTAAYFAGHDPVMQHIKTANQQTLHVISSAGGEAESDVTTDSALKWFNTQPGITLVRINQFRMVVTFYSYLGAVLHTFTTER